MQQFEGTVKDFKSAPIETKDGRSLIKNMIKVSSEGTEKMVIKFTQPNTTFNLPIGTKIRVSNATESTYKGFTEYKVDSKPESFILLTTENKPKAILNQATTQGTGTGGTALRPASTGSYDPNGAKRGNALTNAINLLIHNKGKDPVTSKDASKLLELARMVYSVSTDLEAIPTTPNTEGPEVADEELNTPFD